MFSARIKDIRTENTVSVNNKDSVGFLYKVPHRCLFTAHTVSHATKDLRAARANRVFARIKDIRAENAVSVNNKDSVGFLYKIADSARMVFIRAESAIRADGFPSAQHRNIATLQQRGGAI